MLIAEVMDNEDRRLRAKLARSRSASEDKLDKVFDETRTLQNQLKQLVGIRETGVMLDKTEEIFLKKQTPEQIQMLALKKESELLQEKSQ